jgi:phosphopantothenoylcysteine decarboxylase/phosphopantothenate--cysteine ligase
MPNKPFTVGFAAETHNLEHYALDKLQRKNLDMIAANWVGKAEGGFDSNHNALQVYWQNGKKTFTMTDKTQLANQLLTLIAERLNA